MAAIGLSASLGALAGCGDDGRELSEPTPDQTTTTPTTAAPGASVAPGASGASGPTTAAAAMRLTGQGFVEGGAIPRDNTCLGVDRSPALAWSGVPMGTAELAVVVRDRDADGFVHWVVTGIPAGSGGLAEGTLPEGAVEATNGFDEPGWSGPCPPDGTHHYEFRAYALAQPLALTPGMPGAEAALLVEGAAHQASAALSGTATGPSAG